MAPRVGAMPMRLALIALAASAARADGVDVLPSAAPPLAPTDLHVDLEPSEALAVAPNMVIGWAVPPQHTEAQASFRVRLTGGGAKPSSLGEFECGTASSKALNCSRSDGIPLEALTGYRLPASSSYELQVQLVSAAGAVLIRLRSLVDGSVQRKILVDGSVQGAVQ